MRHVMAIYPQKMNNNNKAIDVIDDSEQNTADLSYQMFIRVKGVYRHNR